MSFQKSFARTPTYITAPAAVVAVPSRSTSTTIRSPQSRHDDSIAPVTPRAFGIPSASHAQIARDLRDRRHRAAPPDRRRDRDAHAAVEDFLGARAHLALNGASSGAHAGVPPWRIVASVALSMFPPETMHTTL